MTAITAAYTATRMSQNAANASASSSPCVGVCKLDRSQNMCIGCGRLLAEIAAWSRMTPEEQHKVRELSAARLKPG
jgi:predicted Fe-S protein YdhL (DUF1289 family)